MIRKKILGIMRIEKLELRRKLRFYLACELKNNKYRNNVLKEEKKMARLTKTNRQKILSQNEGYTVNTSYDSRNSSYDRQYKVLDGELYIRESGKHAWADSRYDKQWKASDEEVHRFLYKYQFDMDIDGID